MTKSESCSGTQVTFVFDPYYKWLGIRPEHQPPDHYRLLGLERFESDRDVIQAAGERQMAHVQSYKIGQQSDLSQRILTEISRAKVCLLNPELKAAYDAELRAAVAPPVAAPPPVAPPMPHVLQSAPTSTNAVHVGSYPAATASVTAPSVLVSAAPRTMASVRRPAPARRKRNALPMAIIAGCIVVIIGAVASTFLFDFAAFRGPGGNAPTAIATLQAESPRSETHRPGPPPRTVPAVPADTRNPVPTAPQQQDARRKINITGNPTPEQSLQAALQATHPWTRFVLFQLTIELAENAAPEDRAQAIPSALQAASILSIEYQMPPDFVRQVELSLRNRPAAPRTELSKAQPPAMPASSSVATTAPISRIRPSNPSSARSESDRPIQQLAEKSKPLVTLEPPRLDLSKKETLVDFQLPAKFQPKDLQLEGIQVSNAPFVKRYPEVGRVDFGSPMRLVIRDELPRAGLELSMHGTGPYYVRIKPLIQDHNEVFHVWSEERVKWLAAKVKKGRKACQEAIDATQASIPNIENELVRVRAISRNSLNSQALSAQQASLDNALKTAKAELPQLEQQLRELDQQIRGFEQLAELTSQVHMRAHVNFRVLSTTDGEQQTLVEAVP